MQEKGEIVRREYATQTPVGGANSSKINATAVNKFLWAGLQLGSSTMHPHGTHSFASGQMLWWSFES